VVSTLSRSRSFLWLLLPIFVPRYPSPLRYDRLLAERQQLQDNRATVAVLKENEDAVRQIARQLKQSTQVLVKNLRQSPGDVENMAKMQRERQQVQDWLRDTRQELLDMGSFSSLTCAVANEIKSKADVVEAIRNADHSRQTAANLLVELEDVRVDTEQAMKDLDEEIAQLKTSYRRPRPGWRWSPSTSSARLPSG